MVEIKPDLSVERNQVSTEPFSDGGRGTTGVGSCGGAEDAGASRLKSVTHMLVVLPSLTKYSPVGLGEN